MKMLDELKKWLQSQRDESYSLRVRRASLEQQRRQLEGVVATREEVTSSIGSYLDAERERVIALIQERLRSAFLDRGRQTAVHRSLFEGMPMSGLDVLFSEALARLDWPASAMNKDARDAAIAKADAELSAVVARQREIAMLEDDMGVDLQFESQPPAAEATTRRSKE